MVCLEHLQSCLEVAYVFQPFPSQLLKTQNKMEKEGEWTQKGKDNKMYLLSTLSYNQPHNLKWTFFLSLSSCYSLSHHWLSLPYHLLQQEITSLFICILCICVTPFTNKFLRAGTFVFGITALVVILRSSGEIAFSCLL